jgi:hypothetical protein
VSVYVDGIMNYGWRLGPSCHMFADTLEELHAMADKIGMKRSWFQNKTRLPHYDLTVSKRRLAVKHGAIEDNDFQHLRRFIRPGCAVTELPTGESTCHKQSTSSGPGSQAHLFH